MLRKLYAQHITHMYLAYLWLISHDRFVGKCLLKLTKQRYTKRDSAKTSLYDPFDEFKILFEVQPVLSKLENVFKELEIKYWIVTKQQTLTLLVGPL